MNLLVFFFVLFFNLLLSPLFSHHTPGGSDAVNGLNSRFIDPFTGKREKPNNYGILSYEQQKGERENRNVHTMNAFGEIVFGEGNFALNISVPYIYFDQKDRGDASRYGKVFIGAKYLPFFDLQKNYIFILESRIGFPSGNHTDRFIGGNYYLGNFTGTLGYGFQKFSIVGKITGLFPLSKLDNKNPYNNDGIPYWARSQDEISQSQAIELKKASIYSAYLTYFAHSKVSFFSGFLYRTPYEGVEKTNATGDKIPLIFREGSVGLSWNFSENYILSISYRYPLNRNKEHRLYESAWQIGFLFEL